MDTIIRLSLAFGAMILAGVAISTASAPIVMVGVIAIMVGALLVCGEVYLLILAHGDAIRDRIWTAYDHIRCAAGRLMSRRSRAAVARDLALIDLAIALRALVQTYTRMDPRTPADPIYYRIRDLALRVARIALQISPTIHTARAMGSVEASYRDAPRIGVGRSVIGALASVHAMVHGALPIWHAGATDRRHVVRAAVALVHGTYPAIRSGAMPRSYGSIIDATAPMMLPATARS